jgi:glycosyltransferase involved in cell wall biosynthesis
MLHLSAPLPIAMRVPTILTIHDVIPLRLPHTTPDNRSEMLRRLRTGARLANKIVTVSEASKADICGDLGVTPEKVVVTYQSADIAPLNDSERGQTPAVLDRHGLKPQRYILFVGAIEPKKNLGRLIEAWLAIDTDIPLVIAGRKAWLWEKEIALAQGAAAKGRVLFLDYVPSSDLPHLYAGALFLAFPSLYEGFGLPPLEAMISGCPVLTSNVASLPEVCGDAALYVDPMSPADIRNKLTRLLGDADLRTRLAQAGVAQAQKFSAAAYAERLKTVYPG